MDWLNYHHLLYFWVVAKQGSIAQASKELRLAHPTISTQIHRLEEVLDQKLFERKGRRLVLTEFGRVALRYADEIFALGREFTDTAKGRPSGRPIRLVVGISDVLPKSIVYRILEPAFRLEENLRVVCREDRSAEEFLGELAMHTVDLVLSDEPAGPGTSVRAFSHPLGECGTAFFAAPELAHACRHRFPRSLDGVPFLLPGGNSALRRALEEWFDSLKVRPQVIAEVDDAALAEIVAEAGLGVFAVPDVVEKEVRRRYKVQLVSRTKEVRQRFYAISVERKIRHPAVLAISDAARKHLFA
ncbi:MAG: transcriptional activator NhaR [Myxococcaceae bacterium]|nr:MAG: transcriptional activator NhaR [Myxococcaceae bacterium]